MTYLALTLGKTLDLFVEGVDLELLLFVLLHFAGILLLNLAHTFSLLCQLLGKLLVLFDLFGKRDLDTPLALLKLLDLSERGS